MQEQWRRVVLTHHRHLRRVGSHAAARNSIGRGDLE